MYCTSECLRMHLQIYIQYLDHCSYFNFPTYLLESYLPYPSKSISLFTIMSNKLSPTFPLPSIRSPLDLTNVTFTLKRKKLFKKLFGYFFKTNYLLAAYSFFSHNGLVMDMFLTREIGFAS